MASSTFTPLQQTQLQLSTFSHCKYSPTLNTFKFLAKFHTPQNKHTLQLLVRASVAASHLETRLSKDEISARKDDYNVESFSFPSINKRVGKKLLEQPVERRVILRDRNAKQGLDSRVQKEEGSSKNLVKNKKSESWKEEKKEKKSRKSKIDSPELTLRIGLDLCSKMGDVVGAIKLYEFAKIKGIKLGQYHFAVLLYLCSAAATGVVQPARSGSKSRILSPKEDYYVGLGSSIEFNDTIQRSFGGSSGEEGCDNDVNGSIEASPQTLDSLVEEMKKNADLLKNIEGSSEIAEIQVTEDVKKLALQKGFEIYNTMHTEKLPMNEATLTSVARMAMAFGDGEMAFDMVKQMKDYGINPRLRSYGPALAIFCNTGDVEKAFVVEKHMLENGVYPEEPELEALLKVSLGAGESEKVYNIFHKLRTSVRQVSFSTADLFQRWFKSKTGSRVGKRKWDQELIAQAVVNGGGGWHGKGWLGTGKWTVCRSSVDSDGFCKSCGEKLVTIDLDPEETEKFAQSVASIASEKEKHSSFQKFQEWLDYHGPFEAVVDAANVGMYNQRIFKPSKVSAVVNGIRQMIPSRKWPLIILHNRRITGEKMHEPVNRMLIEKWRNGDALYATPTGSNDDWYWLYAAIKCRCLLVTNDEMRDHLFQLLGNDIFPKWKERHQVHFAFTETGPEFQMPPPYSVVIQESEKGHWHIPIASEHEREDQRIWLCCTRANSRSSEPKEGDFTRRKNVGERKATPTKNHAQSKLPTRSNHKRNKKEREEIIAVKSKSVVRKNKYSILQELKAAEKLGACVVDFQI